MEEELNKLLTYFNLPCEDELENFKSIYEEEINSFYRQKNNHWANYRGSIYVLYLIVNKPHELSEKWSLSEKALEEYHNRFGYAYNRY